MAGIGPGFGLQHELHWAMSGRDNGELPKITWKILPLLSASPGRYTAAPGFCIQDIHKKSFKTGDRRQADSLYAIFHGQIEESFRRVRLELARGREPRRISSITDIEIVQLIWSAITCLTLEPGISKPTSLEDFMKLLETTNEVVFDPRIVERIRQRIVRDIEDADLLARHGDAITSTHCQTCQGLLDTIRPNLGPSIDPNAPSPPLVAVIERFWTAPERRDVDQKGRRNYNIPLEILTDVVGQDRPINRITREDLRRVQQVITDLTPYAKRDYRDFINLPFPTIADILVERRQIELEEDTDDEPTPYLRPSVINKYLNRLEILFKFAENEGLISQSPAKGLRVKQGKSHRTLFSDDQLAELFTQDYRLEGNNWIPMVCLFQGMRPNEAAQIDVWDVYERDGHWCFDVNEWSRYPDRPHAKGDKRLKNRSSWRIVPIHPRLIRLGFIEHVEQRRRGGFQKVFNVSKWGDSYWDSIRQEMSRMLIAAGIKTDRTVFHSFRHTFNNAMVNLSIDHLRRKYLGGWSLPKDPSDNDYVHQISIPLLYADLEKLDFNITVEGSSGTASGVTPPS
jgi:integrase